MEGNRSLLLDMKFSVGRANWDSWLIMVMFSAVMEHGLDSHEEPLTTK